MSFAESVKTCFRKYVVWQGRAARPEFWYFQLFCLLAFAVAVLVAAAVQQLGFLVILVALGGALPGLSVQIRRLHDVDRSGGWYWIGLIPIAGPIVLLIFACAEGTEGPNRYGEEPA